jgi:hypothetical protein
MTVCLIVICELLYQLHKASMNSIIKLKNPSYYSENLQIRNILMSEVLNVFSMYSTLTVFNPK